MYNRGLPKQLQGNRATSNTRCQVSALPFPASQARPPADMQKCLKLGHFTYECKNPRAYNARESRTKELRAGLGTKRDRPSVEVPDEFKTRDGLADRILKAKEEERARLARERERRRR